MFSCLECMFTMGVLNCLGALYLYGRRICLYESRVMLSLSGLDVGHVFFLLWISYPMCSSFLFFFFSSRFPVISDDLFDAAARFLLLSWEIRAHSPCTLKYSVG